MWYLHEKLVDKVIGEPLRQCQLDFQLFLRTLLPLILVTTIVLTQDKK